MRRGGQGVVLAVVAFAMMVLFVPSAKAAGPASLFLTPKRGAFDVGSTFQVSLFLNTNGNDVNAVDINLSFSPDTLQVVNPTGGTSFVSVWVTQPTYSNEKGTIHFAGGLPTPGINTSAGNVSTITFRAKAPGNAWVEILPSSRVLLNDGKGTNILNSVDRASFTLALAAPGGPSIFSPTHPDQNAWYRNNSVTLTWKKEDGVADYSWWLDQDPNGYADNKPDGNTTTASYADVPSGISFFHLKAKAGEAWGLPSNYALRIDVTAPAKFTPSVDPADSRPGERRVVTFATTDQHSGIDHYEVNILNLDDNSGADSSFTEHASPWLTPSLGVGRYRLVVRAYDKAGNWIDGQVDIQNTIPPSTALSDRLQHDGLTINGVFIPWWVIIASSLLVLVLLLVALMLWRRAHRSLTEELTEDLGRAHAKLQKQHEHIVEELKEERQMSALLQHEVDDLQKDKRE